MCHTCAAQREADSQLVCFGDDFYGFSRVRGLSLGVMGFSMRVRLYGVEVGVFL